MLITITICIEKTKEQIDIQASRHQKICDVIEVLAENQIIRDVEGKKTEWVYTKRHKERVNILLSFEQAKIFNGDIIYI